MTHLAHRDLPLEHKKHDYVILVMGSGSDSAQRLRKALEILWKHKPVNLAKLNFGGVKNRGIDYKTIRDAIQPGDEKTYGAIEGVYTDIRSVKEVLKELKELGQLSVLISGLFDEIFRISKEVGVELPHTCGLSLGIWGNKELLPEKEVLQIASLCGHDQISFRLVEKIARDIKEKKLSIAQAADELARPCVCGSFNTAVAAKLLNQLLSKPE